MNPDLKQFSFTGIGSEMPMIQGEPLVMHFAMAADESASQKCQTCEATQRLARMRQVNPERALPT